MNAPIQRLTVVIHRQTPKEVRPGTFRAWIDQGGRKGDVMLAREGFRTVDGAQQAVDGILLQKFKALGVEPPELVYVIDDCDHLGAK